MRPATVHALAQGIRHTHGLLATLEKWIAATPAEDWPPCDPKVAAELVGLLAALRPVLVDCNALLARSTPGTVDNHRSARQPGHPISTGRS